MENVDTKALIEELEQFKREKEKVRQLIGQIGGVDDGKKGKTINIVFLVILFLLLCIDVMRHVLGIEIPLPPLFSVEIGVFMVSIKIIYLMHQQIKVNHFQFWILNSIEFRLNDLSRKIDELKNRE